ncbi:hypothetical protein E0E62_33215, partial [Streptomyces sp. 16-176A]
MGTPTIRTGCRGRQPTPPGPTHPPPGAPRAAAGPRPGGGPRPAATGGPWPGGLRRRPTGPAP